MTKSILLIDSESAYRNMISARLSALDYRVTATDDCDAVRNLSIDEYFDLAVVENLLARCEGSALARELHIEKKAARILLIVEPSLVLSSPATFCRANGITRLCRGPLSPDNLIAQVEALLKSESPPGTPLDMEFIEPPLRDDMGNDAIASEQLRNIRSSYGQQLPDEFENIRTAASLAAKLGEGERMQELLDDIRRRSHTIYGTAGTVGFPRTAEIARQVNASVNDLGAKSENNAAVWSRILQLVDEALHLSESATLTPGDPLDTSCVANILVVDFSAESFEALNSLRAEGFVNAICATSKDDALMKCVGTSVHGVLIELDPENPDSASEIAHAIRDIDGLENMGIAFMSTDTSVQNRVAAAAAGASKFLRKPIDSVEFSEMARTFYMLRQQKAPKVLLVDDDGTFRAHMAAMLTGENMEVTELEDPGEVLDTLDTFKPDLMLLDVEMPGISGWDVCRMVRSVPLWQHLPILFLTAKSTTEARIQCFASGGDDYIQKPCIKAELIARIGPRLERIRLFNERADRDMLTRLFNRRAFLDQLKLRMADSIRATTPLSLCILDLDHFKHVNDAYGHLTGDRVLFTMGKLLAARFREVDIRCRWGGEEFAVAFYGEEKATAQKILSRVLQDFSEIVFEGEKGDKFNVTFSAGIACFPFDGRNFEALFKAADLRLYKAKELGRNRIIC